MFTIRISHVNNGITNYHVYTLNPEQSSELCNLIKQSESVGDFFPYALRTIDAYSVSVEIGSISSDEYLCIKHCIKGIMFGLNTYFPEEAVKITLYNPAMKLLAELEQRGVLTKIS